MKLLSQVLGGAIAPVTPLDPPLVYVNKNVDKSCKHVCKLNLLVAPNIKLSWLSFSEAITRDIQNS